MENITKEDLLKFDRMTKPVTMRSMKTIKQWVQDITHVIEDKVYNILYKLNIIKLYSFSDRVYGKFFYPKFNPQLIMTDTFMAYVICKLQENTDIKESYYYIDTKKGRKKLKVLEDECHVVKVMDCYLDNVCIKFSDSSDTWHLIYKKDGSCSPIFIKQVCNTDHGIMHIDPTIIRTEYRTDKFNVRSKSILNDFNDTEVTYTYQKQCLRFMNFLSNLDLKDLEIHDGMV